MPKQIQNKELSQKIVLCIKKLRRAKNVTPEVFYFDAVIHLARKTKYDYCNTFQNSRVLRNFSS